jgi:hypothetical protein
MRFSVTHLNRTLILLTAVTAAGMWLGAGALAESNADASHNEQKVIERDTAAKNAAANVQSGAPDRKVMIKNID